MINTNFNIAGHTNHTVSCTAGGKKSERHFRVYDPVQSANKGIKILHYDSLDASPEIILCEGIFDKDSYAVSLAVCEPARAA